MLVRAIRLSLVIAFGIILVPGGVQAASFGPFTLPMNGFMFFQQPMFGPNAAISDTYTFDVPTGPLGSFTVASTQDPNPPNHNPPATFGIANLTFTWQELSLSQQFTNGDGVLDQSAQLVASLLAGTYHLVVTGNALATGGAYSYSLSTTPLPAALVLFGSGLVGLTLLGRRRRKAVDLSI